MTSSSARDGRLARQCCGIDARTMAGIATSSKTRCWAWKPAARSTTSTVTATSTSWPATTIRAKRSGGGRTPTPITPPQPIGSATPSRAAAATSTTICCSAISTATARRNSPIGTRASNPSSSLKSPATPRGRSNGPTRRRFSTPPATTARGWWRPTSTATARSTSSAAVTGLNTTAALTIKPTSSKPAAICAWPWGSSCRAAGRRSSRFPATRTAKGAGSSGTVTLRNGSARICRWARSNRATRSNWATSTKTATSTFSSARCASPTTTTSPTPKPAQSYCWATARGTSPWRRWPRATAITSPGWPTWTATATSTSSASHTCGTRRASTSGSISWAKRRSTRPQPRRRAVRASLSATGKRISSTTSGHIAPCSLTQLISTATATTTSSPARGGIATPARRAATGSAKRSARQWPKWRPSTTLTVTAISTSSARSGTARTPIR